MSTAPPAVLVPRRFNGPPSSGNGGYSAGALASLVAPDDAVVTVRLRRPPPLDVPLEVAQPDDDGWRAALDPGGEVVMAARTAAEELRPVAAVPLAQAREAEQRYAGLRSHPFPTCVVCGTERPDGLRVHPGRVDDDDGAVRVAGTWVPEEAGVPWVWAALDCIGAWAGDLEERMLVLGTMTAQVHRTPAVGVEHVVVGGDRGTEGRRARSAASLYASDGSLLATAEHTWIAVDPRAFS